MRSVAAVFGVTGWISIDRFGVDRVDFLTASIVIPWIFLVAVTFLVLLLNRGARTAGSRGRCLPSPDRPHDRALRLRGSVRAGRSERGVPLEVLRTGNGELSSFRRLRRRIQPERVVSVRKRPTVPLDGLVEFERGENGHPVPSWSVGTSATDFDVDRRPLLRTPFPVAFDPKTRTQGSERRRATCRVRYRVRPSPSGRGNRGRSRTRRTSHGVARRTPTRTPRTW